MNQSNVITFDRNDYGFNHLSTDAQQVWKFIVSKHEQIQTERHCGKVMATDPVNSRPRQTVARGCYYQNVYWQSFGNSINTPSSVNGRGSLLGSKTHKFMCNDVTPIQTAKSVPIDKGKTNTCINLIHVNQIDEGQNYGSGSQCSYVNLGTNVNIQEANTFQTHLPFQMTSSEINDSVQLDSECGETSETGEVCALTQDQPDGLLSMPMPEAPSVAQSTAMIEIAQQNSENSNNLEISPPMSSRFSAMHSGGVQSFEQEFKDQIDRRAPRRRPHSDKVCIDKPAVMEEHALISSQVDLLGRPSCVSMIANKVRKLHEARLFQSQKSDQNQAAVCKKVAVTSFTAKGFRTPFKLPTPKSAGSCSRDDTATAKFKTPTTPVSKGSIGFVNAAIMSTHQQEKMLEEIAGAAEIILTLLYHDGSSQLREKIGVGDEKCVSTLMAAASTKLCFDAQELMYTVITELGCDQRQAVLKWSVYDPRIGAWLLDPDEPQETFSATAEVLGVKMSKFDMMSSDELLKQDMIALTQVVKVLSEKLKQQSLWDLFTLVEMKLCPILAIMDRRGIKMDTNHLSIASATLQRGISDVEKAVHSAAGHSFLISSHVQLRQVIFDELKLDEQLITKKALKMTAVGNLKSTSESVLQQLADLHPLPRLVLEHRRLSKMKSTYVDGLLTHVKDGYLHTNWEHTSAATGRLTSANPNIQSVPKEPLVFTNPGQGCDASREVTMMARDAFVSHEGYSFLAADFQQVELRLLAHLCADPVLLGLFDSSKFNQDIFIQLTSQWLGTPESQVTYSDRERTKRVVYSVMYGIGKDRLAGYLNMGVEEAKAITNSFLGKFRGVGQFTQKCVKQCRLHGYVTTIFNRRRIIRHIRSNNYLQRLQAERQAMNFAVQGSAADICKTAMIAVEKALCDRPELRASMLVQIHDELLLEVADDHLASVAGLVSGCMQDISALCGSMVTLTVPLPVSLSTGKTWGHMDAYTP